MGHEPSDQVTKVLLSDADLVWYFGDHEPPHFLGVGESRGGHIGSVVDPGHPGEGVPELAVVVVLVLPIII